jgi:hypothetical protein
MLSIKHNCCSMQGMVILSMQGKKRTVELDGSWMGGSFQEGGSVTLCRSRL